jgi:hypothetical protein
MKKKSSTLERLLLAEIERLKARVAELESELAARPPGPKPVITLDTPNRKPVATGKRRQGVDYNGAWEKKRYCEGELRAAVKAAEERYHDKWWRAGKLPGHHREEYVEG